MRDVSLIARYAEQISEKLHRPLEEIVAEGLFCGDFSTQVEVKFSDGSHALFRYAFFVVDQKSKTCAIFSEHCGYIELPSVGVMLKETKEYYYTDDLYEED